MKWIVGLGNPGPRYHGTPHNAGFAVVDRLAAQAGGAWRSAPRAEALMADVELEGAPARLVKPLTYMNRSGEALAALWRQATPAPDDVLVVTDDVNLPLGRLRIRPRGRHGGHNGLRSIIERLGHDQFARLRVGIRPPWPIDDLTEFVLRRLPPEETAQLNEMIELAADAVRLWAVAGTRAAADKFNGLRRFAADDTTPSR